MKRSGKFYRKNEAEIMESLGLKPTINSGSTWIEKEDGQNDYLICQLKSTDAESIRVQQKDIRILEENAITAHKIPLFAIQFLNTNEVWLMAKPEDFSDVAQYINTGKTTKRESDFDVEDIKPQKPKNKISSSKSARLRFQEEQNKKYDKTRSAVK